jgi:hypothetical protein
MTLALHLGTVAAILFAAFMIAAYRSKRREK